MFHSPFLKSKWLLNRFYRGLKLYHAGHSFELWKNLFFHLSRRVFSEKVSNLITIGVTYKCQCHCVHCSTNVPTRRKFAELETPQIKSVIDQAKQMGVLRVTFFGGEPLLRKDIFELIHYAHTSGLITRINTNGDLLNRESVSKLKDAGLALCDVSLDDPDPGVHDTLRGLPGLHEKAIQGIRLLKEYKIFTQIVTYAARRNIPDGLKRIIDLGKSLGVFAVSIVFPIATGCWYYSFKEILNEEEKEAVRRLGDCRFVHVELSSPRSKCSLINKSGLYVSPEGDVTPCPFVPYSLGNVKENALGEIWSCFCRSFKLEFEGDCPMNSIEFRRALEEGIESVQKHIGLQSPSFSAPA